MLRITISIDPNTPHEGTEALRNLAAKELDVAAKRLISLRLVKRSVDARAGRPLSIVLTIDAEVIEEAQILSKRKRSIQPAPKPKPLPPISKIAQPPRRPLVVGMGPAGLFAAYILARAGMRPLVIERGQPVEQRTRDVDAFFEGGPLNPSSNVLFGEGGAGTFSDGKLTTGIKDPWIRFVLETFVSFGAPHSILYMAKPHIGTDRLRGLLPQFRAALLDLGAEIRFGTQLEDLHLQNGALRGVTLHQGDSVSQADCDTLILAAGHSARDTLEMLHTRGVALAQKPFSIGVRIEHPQATIDRAQYGAYAGHPALGAAEYKLAVHLPGGRDVYSFCMCPGGDVVAAASEPGGINVNGMSRYARDGRNANSALLVGVTPQDFPDDGALSGVALQRQIERAAFALAGNTYRAPAQRVGDFLKKQSSAALGGVQPTYRPGVTLCALDDLLPPFVAGALRSALPRLGQKLRGFDRPDAVLTGPETRSSSPVRILREKDGQSTNVAGLYPAGEGAGYAGGITSAAVDGIRAAMAVLDQI